MRKFSQAVRMFSSRNIFWLVAVSIAVSAATSARADTLLRMKHTPGEKETFHSDQEMSMNMSIDGQTMTTKVKTFIVFTGVVKAVDENGVAAMEMTIERMKMSMKLPQGQDMNYDSDEKKERTGIEKMLADQFAGFVGKPIETKVDAMGNIKEMKMPEGMKSMPGMGNMLSDDNLKQMYGGIAFPEEAVAVGKTWTSTSPMKGVPGMGQMTINQTFKYMGPDKDNPKLENIEVVMKMESKPAEDSAMKMTIKDQESKGRILFDNKAGRLQNSKVTTKMTFEIQMPGRTLTSSVETKAEIKFVPGSEAK